MFKKNSIRSDFAERVRLSIESLSRGDEWRYYCTNSDSGFQDVNYRSEFNTLLKNHEIIGILLQLESKKITFVFNSGNNPKLIGTWAWVDTFIDLSTSGFEFLSKPLVDKSFKILNRNGFNADPKLSPEDSAELGKEIGIYLLNAGHLPIYPLMLLLEEPEVVFLDKSKDSIKNWLSRTSGFIKNEKDHLYYRRTNLSESSFCGFSRIRKDLIENHSSKILYNLQLNPVVSDDVEKLMKFYNKLAGYMIKNEDYKKILDNNLRFFKKTMNTFSECFSSGLYFGDNLKTLFVYYLKKEFATTWGNGYNLSSIISFSQTNRHHLSDFESVSSNDYSCQLVDLLVKNDESIKTFYVTSIFDSFVIKGLTKIGERFTSEIKEEKVNFVLNKSILDFDDQHFKFSVASLKQVKLLVDSGNFKLSDDFKNSISSLSNLLIGIIK